MKNKTRPAMGILLLAALAAGMAGRAGAEEPKVIADLGMEFEPIPAGNFTMGGLEGKSDDPDTKVDCTAHPVTLTQNYWMGKTEVTQGQWKALMNTTIKDQAKLALADDHNYIIIGQIKTVRQYFSLRKDSEPNSGKVPMIGNEKDNEPMYWVNQRDALIFCHKLTLREEAAGRLPDGYEYALPSEAQWEYACRAGTTTGTYAGPLEVAGESSRAVVLEDIAWYGLNCSQGYEGRGWNSWVWFKSGFASGIVGPRPVATKKPNAWGLYDMLGDISEWTKDWYASYPKTPVTDPLVMSGDLPLVVARGGDWMSKAYGCQAGAREPTMPGLRFVYLGFRVALVPKPPMGL